MYAQIDSRLKTYGLMARGGFHPRDGDQVPGHARTVIMIGNAGHDMWRVFSGNQSHTQHPLDTWTRNVLAPIAEELSCRVVYPFQGPPYYPFQKWAMQADNVTPSPIGPLIHPQFGLWHAYRAAFLFHDVLPLPDKAEGPTPCESCQDKLCLDTCPVDAFSHENYDVAACRQHIARPEGRDCLKFGCQARTACPVGKEYIYHPDQADFHMRHFLVS